MLNETNPYFIAGVEYSASLIQGRKNCETAHNIIKGAALHLPMKVAYMNTPSNPHSKAEETFPTHGKLKPLFTSVEGGFAVGFLIFLLLCVIAWKLHYEQPKTMQQDYKPANLMDGNEYLPPREQ